MLNTVQTVQESSKSVGLLGFFVCIFFSAVALGVGCFVGVFLHVCMGGLFYLFVFFFC